MAFLHNFDISSTAPVLVATSTSPRQLFRRPGNIIAFRPAGLARTYAPRVAGRQAAVATWSVDLDGRLICQWSAIQPSLT